MQVLDYSDGFPGAAAIKAAGYGGAVRYIGLPGFTKNTTAAELQDFTRHARGMALVFEHFDTDWQNGYAWGRQKYRQARNHADAIGFPSTRPIYMAVDRDVVTSADFQACHEYLRGARDEAGGSHLVGEYGEYDVCEMAARQGLTDWHWQCRAWSGTPIRYFAARHLFQLVGTVTVGGVGCDINDVLRDDWGQHLLEDEMSWDAWLENHYGGQVKASSMLAFIDEHVNNLAAEQAAMRALLAESIADPDITAERLEEVVKTAVASANAAHLAQITALMDKATAVVKDIVGARDEDLAAKTLTAFAKLLAPARDNSDGQIGQ